MDTYTATLKRRGLLHLVTKPHLTAADRHLLRRVKHDSGRKHYATGQ